MGYLICNKCRGYYELQPGELPEDFDECQGGGKLEYKKENSNYKTHFRKILFIFSLLPYILFKLGYFPSDIPFFYIVAGTAFITFIIALITGIIELKSPNNRNYSLRIKK